MARSVGESEAVEQALVSLLALGVGEGVEAAAGASRPKPVVLPLPVLLERRRQWHAVAAGRMRGLHAQLVRLLDAAGCELESQVARVAGRPPAAGGCSSGVGDGSEQARQAATVTMLRFAARGGRGGEMACAAAASTDSDMHASMAASRDYSTAHRNLLQAVTRAPGVQLMCRPGCKGGLG